MKSIFKISALALLATAVMFSCQREEDFREEVPAVKEVHTFTLKFANPATKIAVSDEGKTTWAVGDEIMIHGGTDGKDRQLVTLTADNISADGKEAVITFEMAPYDRTDAGVVSKFYAQYPARLVPEGSMYYECRFTATNDFLMAACDMNDAFVFYNLCGLISYKVTGDFDAVEFAGNNGETVGYSTVYQARVRLDDGKDAPSVNYNKPGNGSGNPVPMKVFEAALKAGETNYIFLPAGAEFTGGFEFKFLKDGQVVKIAKTEKAVKVGPSTLLALGDITAKLEDYTPPQSSDHKSAITNAKDLSSLQANSYVITAPGAYKFPALKGNSADAAGNVFGAEIVWESYNNAEEVTANSVIAAVDFEDNWIYFQTPEALKPGNALIAALDVNKKIIWSWHIWVPKTEITTNTYGLYNKELMDRNLGALVAAKAGEATPVESFGLTYQWGRKDPFVGPAATSGSANATVAGTALSAAAGQISLGESIANPTVLGHMDDADWITAPDNTLWQDAEKTIYDPCPAGYKVPARDKEQPLMSADLSAVTGWAESAEFGYVTMGDPVAVFPVSGYRDDYGVGIMAKVYQRVAYWTSYASSEKKGYLLNIRLADYGNAHALSEGPKARGGYVRCVKMEASAPAVEPAKVGDVLWAEDWTGATNKMDMTTYEFGGTTVYGGGKVTYEYVSNGSTTYTYVDNQMDGATEQPNLLISKAEGSWTIKGIPSGQAKYAVLSIKVNSKRDLVLTTTTEGVVIGERQTGEETAKPYTYSWGIELGSAETFDFTFTNKNNSSNIRVDDVKLVVANKPAPALAIDGKFDDWANIEGGKGTAHEFKVASDADYIYFYSHRNTEGRYSEIWGGNGYIYIAFDVDGDATNGVTLNSNGPYDFIGFFLPYGGSAEEPAIIEAPSAGGGWLPETNTLEHMECKGVVNDKGAFLEYRIPRADLPAIPTTPVTVVSWGNKDLSKVTLTATL